MRDRTRDTTAAASNAGHASAQARAERRGDQQKDYYQATTKKRRRAKANVITPAPGERQVLVACRIPESIVARMHRIKEEAIVNGKYPWRTMSQVQRGLIYKGFEALQGDPIIDEGMPYLNLMKHVEGLRNPRIEAEAALHTSRTELHRLLHIGARKEAVQFYWTTQEIAKGMAPSIWRDWLLEQLEKQFPDLHASDVAGVQVSGRRARR